MGPFLLCSKNSSTYPRWRVSNWGNSNSAIFRAEKTPSLVSEGWIRTSCNLRTKRHRAASEESPENLSFSTRQALTEARLTAVSKASNSLHHKPEVSQECRVRSGHLFLAQRSDSRWQGITRNDSYLFPVLSEAWLSRAENLHLVFWYFFNTSF